ncbi:MAG: ABC transporter ATP-binding protein [Deltaproteobacteria bacterium]|jgi:iron complex transport system ATP-binding protein|nr:ABC transporter ATP-binding protein [Deltaproteobacteria bacterium]
MNPFGPTALTLENLTIGYRSPVVTDINLTVPPGVFVSLLGANGSGKTTLLRTISRRLKPLAGRITLFDQPLKTFKALDLAKTLSVVLTDKAEVPMLRVLEFVALGRHPHSDFLGRLTDKDLLAVEESLFAVKADKLANRFVDELSDGERQKVVLARALAQNPRITLLDEPTAHLDLKHRLEFLAILRNLCRQIGLTVIAAAHDVESAARFSDLVMTLKDGRLQDFGRPEEVLKPEAIRTLYDCPEANFDSALGGLEMTPDGRAGRAFVLGGQDSAALAYRLLAKQGYALATGFFLATDLDAHVARSLGAKVFSFKNADNPPLADLLAESLVELGQCDFLVIAGDMGGFSEGLTKLKAEAKKLNIPILSLGPNGELTPLIEGLALYRSSRAA